MTQETSKNISSNHHQYQNQLSTYPSTVSDFRAMDVSSPISDSSCNFSGNTFADEEIVLLASNKPKRPAGRIKFKETRHPIYRGVRLKKNGKWVSEVRDKKSRIWLGTFPTPEMAARAHDVAVISLRGRSACLNFADSVWRIPTPKSLDAKDIQRAAGEAARALHQPELMEENSSSVVNPVENSSENKSGNTSEKVFYMDEEAEFGMPGFLADLAEGLLLSPPPLRGFNWDDVESNIDVSLWSYSI